MGDVRSRCVRRRPDEIFADEVFDFVGWVEVCGEARVGGENGCSVFGRENHVGAEESVFQVVARGTGFAFGRDRAAGFGTVSAEGDYVAILERAAALGVVGGGIYDALLAGCAMKAKAEMIYTWNTKHFARMGGDVAARVKSPDWQE